MSFTLTRDIIKMSENNNGNSAELTTSQINQSEAGPDIVQLDHNLLINMARDRTEDYYKTELNDSKTPDTQQKSTKQPVNIVAPLKIESRGISQQANLEEELVKLQEMLKIQEKLTQQRVTESESQLTQRLNQLCSLQDKVKLSEERELTLNKKLAEQAQGQEQLSIVMQDYEMLIGKLTAEVESHKEIKSKVELLETEKESALVHLGNVEAAFSDVHSKYEKCKKVVDEYKKNDARLKDVISELRESVRVKEKTLENLQNHAGSQLEAAQREIARINRDHEQEVARLRAMLRRTELKVISLQEALDQKIKENQELTTICDDLIAGKGYNRHN